MKTLLVLFCYTFPLVALSQDSGLSSLQFPKVHVTDVLAMYQKMSGKPVLVSLDLNAIVTIESTTGRTREANLEFIRKTLLERYGIELRTSDRGETLATWSQDPKYPRHSDPPKTEAEERVYGVKVRPIRPKGSTDNAPKP